MTQIHTIFLEGQDAYAKGNDVCPYPQNSEAYRSWERGYNDAWFADRDVFKVTHG